MRIEEDMKLDFKDVLFRPKRSTLRSRSEVDLNRKYIFRNSKMEWTGVPVMASNMDTVGTFEMFEVLKTFQMFTCIHKHYPKERWHDLTTVATAKIITILRSHPARRTRITTVYSEYVTKILR